jgi:peptide/nickel transport system substrate-binding protein
MRSSTLILLAAMAVTVTPGIVGVVPTAAASYKPHGTVTFADQPGSPPTSVFPFANFANSGISSAPQFQYIMYRPLYWTGDPGQTKLQAQMSLANPPVYSADGRTVTVTLKNYQWSDGQPVTSRDVEFWVNLLKYEKVNWYDYGPGAIPDNIVSMTIITPRQFSITFNATYSHTWLLDNLGQIIPIPQHSWDRTSVGGPIGDYDATAQGAAQVYAFLSQQAAMLSLYGTNPLWKVVDGPYRVESFDPSTGRASLVVNTDYSGPVKPEIETVIEVPFTSATAEFDALRSGSIDYGYVPAEDVSQIPSLKSSGLDVQAWVPWGVTFVATNFTNPTIGPIFDQLYIRQAMQHLVDQPTYIKDIYHGYAYPTYGPVPLEPASKFVSPLLKANPYPYDVSRAMSLLKSHGWKVVAGGTDTCDSPGTASDDCGAGIVAGTKLSLRLQYASGSEAWASEMEALESSFSKAGIQLTLSEATVNTIFASAFPCEAASGDGCSWQAVFYGAGEYYGFGFNIPTGEDYFGCGAGDNFDGYCSSEMTKLIAATHIGSGLASLFTYENYLAEQIPYLWLPQPDYQISAVKKGLTGVYPQDPALNLTPEYWRLK